MHICAYQSGLVHYSTGIHDRWKHRKCMCNFSESLLRCIIRVHLLCVCFESNCMDGGSGPIEIARDHHTILDVTLVAFD